MAALSAEAERAWACVVGSAVGQPRRIESLSAGQIDEAMGDQTLVEGIAALHRANLLPLVRGWYNESMCDYVREHVQVAFWTELEEFEQVRRDAESSALLSWTGRALSSAFGRFDRAMKCHRQVASRLDELVARCSPPRAGGPNELLAERSLSRMTHAQVFSPASTSTTLQDMLHLHLREQFARRNWVDREEQKRLRAAIRSERDVGSDSESESEEESSEEEEDDEDGGLNTSETGIPVDKTQPESLVSLASSMGSVGIMPLCVEITTEMLFSQMALKIRQTCAGKFGSRLLDTLREWLARVVHPWLSEILQSTTSRPGALDAERGAQLFEQWRARLDFHLYETVAKLRISELFDIIVQFPIQREDTGIGSRPALEDLKECLSVTRQRSELIASLSSTLKKRLLIPGAKTKDIIEVFIGTVKVLRFLDPQLPAASSLPPVSAHIKDYLRGRHDTIKEIVVGLTENNGIYEDQGTGRRLGGSTGGLGRSDGGTPAGGGAEDYDDDSEEENDDTPPWNPEPVGFGSGAAGGYAGTASGARSGGHDVDIITMLVGIYGSKELFVNEYRKMLSKKLLGKPHVGANLDLEYRTLELLKQRFGEDSLHKCEVMLKDIKSSERCSINIDAKLDPNSSEHDPEADSGLETCPTSVVKPMIISQVFWPTLPGGGAGGAKQDKIRFPHAMNRAMESYGKLYNKINKPRILQWAPKVGQVTLDVEFENGITREYTVDPLRAALLGHFGPTDEEKTLNELVELSGIGMREVRRSMGYWVDMHVLREEEPRLGSDEGQIRYVVVPDPAAEEARVSNGNVGPGGGSGHVGGRPKHMEEDEEDEDVQAAQGGDGEAQTMLESYVIGMITNHKQLPLDRIHNMLKMFMQDPHPYDKSEAELRAILQRMIADDRLENQGGAYALKSTR